jgi:phosphonate transport system substrate-binding protein
VAAIICLSILCNSCKGKSKNYEPTYSTGNTAKKILFFGVPTQSYYEIDDLFIKYLNDHLVGTKIQTVANSNFLGYNEKLDSQYFHLTIVNGMRALECARNGYTIVGHVVEESYAGGILVNKDSSINRLTDLKGKTIATPGYPALAAHMLQMVYLGKNGVDVSKEVKFLKVQSLESVFLNTFLGRCSAGFSTTNGFNRFIKRRPEIAAKVEMKWVTPAIIANAFVIRNDVDKELAEQVKTLLFSMHLNDQGRKALQKIGYFRFEPADSTTYNPVKDFLKEYRALVADQKQ